MSRHAVPADDSTTLCFVASKQMRGRVVSAAKQRGQSLSQYLRDCVSLRLHKDECDTKDNGAVE